MCLYLNNYFCFAFDDESSSKIKIVLFKVKEINKTFTVFKGKFKIQINTNKKIYIIAL